MGSVYIIAEAGSNWRMGSHARDRAMGKRLIEVAAEAGADAVKFQVFRAKSVYAQGAGSCPHLARRGLQEDIGEIFRDLEMPREMVGELASYCRKVGIDFMASFFSAEDFECVDPLVAIHKIASPELHHPHLLELAAHSGKPTLLSTGISTLDEIEWAIEMYNRAGGRALTLLQCTVEYPTSPSAMHLRAMVTLEKTFGLPVGLSDHSRDPTVAPLTAVALGGRVIEKHFTLHRGLVGPDHSWAITGEELMDMVAKIRLAEEMLGSEQKEVVAAEEPLRLFSRRSLHTTRTIKKGERLQMGINIDILRPGRQSQGVHPRLLSEVEGRIAVRTIEKGSGIRRGDWQ